MASRDEIVGMLREAGLSQDKICHSIATADVSLKVAQRLLNSGVKLDKDVVEAGALLHDIGLSQAKRGSAVTEADEIEKPFPEHCVIGAKMALNLGFSEGVAECPQAHELWTTEEAIRIGLPPPVVGKDYGPTRIESKIVAFCDFMLFAMVQKKGTVDPWKDPDAWGKSALPYFNACYFDKIGEEITMDNPILRRKHQLLAELISYVKKDDFPPAWEGMSDVANAVQRRHEKDMKRKSGAR